MVIYSLLGVDTIMRDSKQSFNKIHGYLAVCAGQDDRSWLYCESSWVMVGVVYCVTMEWRYGIFGFCIGDVFLAVIVLEWQRHWLIQPC